MLACSNVQAINKTYNLRTLVLIFGGSLIPFGYIPGAVLR